MDGNDGNALVRLKSDDVDFFVFFLGVNRQTSLASLQSLRVVPVTESIIEFRLDLDSFDLEHLVKEPRFRRPE
ncbi:hypothetical protein QR98_0062810 [Sarcoptes scabiei]|uniref:Uncharacterized protein n=1 Tax=Sarcoptes scabiei TaxID=52283 RepID=A0A132AA61_SARSC|nr:hypothetical protein QR98_0062810 [Sarcoptes scabiei]